MPTRPLKTLALLVCAALSTLAHADDDPPGRVGRVAITQGQVSVAQEFGAEAAAAQVNWPVTSGNLVTTAQGARTELRVGSMSIRLDGDSSLEVIELDDATVRVRLHYGSASIRALNQDTLAGFTLETPQVRVRLEQPGRVRVDAERVRDTSAVNVFEGVALVEGSGSTLTVRAGRRAEIDQDDDVRTLVAQRDGFDDWAAQRDRYQDSAANAVRYVGSEMTGYEDLDRYGSWSSDNDYGPLWYPTVAAAWVPYRDGSWAWVEPWGWTWVDNAPWGYAPFHYGRWVHVHNRWAWAPGRHVDRPVWAPALVGWVGGNGWSVAFRDRQHHPALGWYPLAPWDRFEPGWRAPEAHLRWWNGAVRPDRRPRDYRPQGLTVVPQDRFNQPGRVNVPRAPIATVPPTIMHNLPAAAPPAPVMPAGFANRPPRPDDRQGRPGRWERNDGRFNTDSVARDGFARRGAQPVAGREIQLIGPTPGHVPPAAPAQPLPVTSPTPHLPPQPLTTVTSPTPHQGGLPTQLQTQPQPQPGWQGRERPWRDRDDRDGRDGRDWREGREGRDPGEWRRNRPQQQPFAQPAQPTQQQPAQMTTQPAQGAMMGATPVTPHRGGWERREAPAQPAPSMMPSPRPAPQPMMTAPPSQPAREMAREMPRPAPQMTAPQPAPAPAAAPAARPAEARGRIEPRDSRGHEK